MRLLLKLTKGILVLLIILLFIAFLLSRGHVFEPEELSYGMTFSAGQATALGFEWQKMFTDILEDLGAKKIRLSAYWDEVEPSPGEFRWEDLDWQVAQASEHDAEIILAVGARLPRWPECHYPGWTGSLDEAERAERQLVYIEEVIKRYAGEVHIAAWQVENEPFLPHFGECPPPDGELLDKEIALVRSLDKRPIVVTDSGELSIWIPAARRADIFGTTMYRDTYSLNLKRYIHYPIQPGFFRFKRNLTRLFASPGQWIVIELQAEPWAPEPYQSVSQAERDRTMNLQKFKEILEFARQTGFQEFYLWGVEYWYWEKEANGNSAMWDKARELFQINKTINQL